MAERVPIKVPDIGDFHDVEVIEILVKPGEAVKKEQSLITLESDKASMEIPSPMAGVVREMRVKLGDKVSEGSLILEMEPASPAASAGGPAEAAATSRPAPAPAPARPAPAPAPAVSGAADVECEVL